MSTYPGADATFRIPKRDPVAAECTSVSCELSGLLADPRVITGIVFVGIVALLAFAYIRDAKECCREERRRVVDERDAFKEFASRVASLEATPADAAATGLGGPVVGVQRGSGFASPGDVRLARVVDAYENTVMSLPHYRKEYDETVTESLAAELGPDATTTLRSGGTLSPGLQSALVTRSRHAADSRSTLVDAIDEELEALEDAEETLSGIDCSRRRLNEHLEGLPGETRLDAEIDVWQRLQHLERRCDEAAAARQDHVHDPPMSVSFDAIDDTPTFYEYVYGPLSETTYPVLRELSELADRIRSDRDRLTGRIADGR